MNRPDAAAKTKHELYALPAQSLQAAALQWSVATLLGLLALAAVTLGWRRAAGAMTQAPEPPLLLTAGLLAAAVAALVRALRRHLSGEATQLRLKRTAGWLPSASLAVFAAALSFPGTPLAARIAFWGLLAAEECWAFRSVLLRRQTGRRGAPRGQPLRLDPPQAPSPHPLSPVLPALPARMPEADLTQQLTRSQAADGSEILAGWLRLPFAAGQRTASAHVAFCPPFPHTPALTVQQLDGPQARIKTTQLLPYGMRLDLKLSEQADKPQSVLLQFSACWKDERLHRADAEGNQ